MEERLRDSGDLSNAEFKTLVAEHDVLRNETGDAVHIAVAGQVYGRIEDTAEEIASQFNSRGEVDRALLVQLAGAVALRASVHRLMQEQIQELLENGTFRSSQI